MTAPQQQPDTLFPRVSERYDDRARYPRGIAYTEGQYLPISEAKISILDWGFLHSDATYDTVHVWDGRFFRLDLHLDRFFSSVSRLRMRLSQSREEIAAVLSNCVALSGLRNAYVEMICTRGVSPTFSRDPRDAENRFLAFAVPFGSVANEAQMADGLHVIISDVQRIPPASVDPTIKNYHWLDLVEGVYQAFDRGGDTVLLRDQAGNIAEGPGFNVFAVKDGALTTPERGVLPGITRRTVFDLCARLSLKAEAAPLTERALRGADEVFVTSTAGGIMPVTRIDRAPVADGRVGPVTKRLSSLYWEMHSADEWSTPVRYPAQDKNDKRTETGGLSQ
ncbi:aminotransferase class IV [Chelativorans salis]|uniref:Probable branched-chain-amino-acid aminotransferase n=1 Tax=Chelativorans salis TaxID=2978478 RepID=A0ABT2LJ20_9HYPH|nr:aminotransferase class IV [Chelativorans sp. EGI FJ00035]MCT7374590.1 aminotransferase class IV [Chelativorans sp. EGI FJ00035]